MGREAWIYGLAFLAVLAAGAFLIVPRLGRTPNGTPSSEAGPRDGEAPPRPMAPPAPRAWRTVEVQGPRGSLRGPLKDVQGAEVRWLGERGAAIARLEVRATADEVAFGAAGHRWRSVPADALATTSVVTLDVAAPTLVVRVREADGRPAADVPVPVLPASPGPVRRTDEGGTVVLDDLAPGLVVLRPGGRERSAAALRLLAGRDRDALVVLEPAWTIRGRAVDGEGAPLPGVRVEGVDDGGVVGRAAVAGDDGRFAWRGPAAPVLALRLTAPERFTTAVEAVPPDRGELASDVGDVELLLPSAVVEGRVLAGAASDRVRVVVEPAVAAVLRELFGAGTTLHARRVVEPDPDGRFRVPDLPPGIPLRVQVRGAGLPLDDVVRLGPGQTLTREYAPPPGQTLHGSLSDAVVGGGPAAGVRLRVSTEPVEADATLPGDREVVTDAAGRFVVDGLPRSLVYVRAHVPGRRTVLEEVRLPRSTAFDLALTAVPDGDGQRVSGRLLDDHGNALAGVTVRAAGRVARTDDGGTFRLDGVEGFGDTVVVAAGYEPGTAPLPVDPTPYVLGARRRVTPGGEPLGLVLSRAASLRFRALDGLDDEPLAFVHVVLRTEGGQVLVDRAVAPRDGEVRLEGLLPEGASLSLFSLRHRLVVPMVMLEPARETDLGDLALGRGIHVTGQVVDGTGRPVAGARLGAVEAGWLHRRGSDPTREREIALRHVLADDEGRFELDGLDPREPGLLAAWAPGFAPAARRVVLEKFRDSAHASVQIQLRRGGFLDVELIEAGTNRPVSGAFFDLEDARNHSDYLDLVRRGVLSGPVGADEDWRRASANFLLEQEEGRYRLGPIAPGAYEVLVDRPGFRALRRKLTILDPADALVDMSSGASRPLTETLSLTWELEPGP